MEVGHTPLPAWGQAWVAMFPCLMTANLGKNNDQTYTPMPVDGNESDLIDTFNSTVATLEGFLEVERCSGKEWDDSIPPGSLADNDEVITAMETLKDTINSYKTLCLSQIIDIDTIDTDATKQAESLAAKDYIETILQPALDVWLGYDDFQDLIPEPTSLSEFESFDISTLSPSKGNPTQLGVLKAVISARNAFNITRKSQLNSYLGDVVQDFDSGAITSKSGLYGQRGTFLVLRLHMLTGSLSKVIGMETAITAQDSTVAANNAGADAYNSVMTAVKFKIPSNGGKLIHVLDTSGFSVGDSVYVCGDGQAELSGTIVSLSGTRVDLDFVVPQKYTPANFSRMYKVL
jgi:hypothetical protein